MALHRDPARRFDHALRSVSSVVSLPPEIVALRTRLAEFTGRTGTPIADRLAAAVLDGDTAADVDLLWAVGLAEAASNPALHNDLLSKVRNRIHAAIRLRYSEHAIAVYDEVAAKFNTEAQAFTDAAKIVDPEHQAEQIVDAADKERESWRAAAAHSDKMHRLLEPLHAAATLGGICGSDPDAALALTVDADGLHRREVWDAWHIEDREAKAQRAAANHSAFTTDIITTPRSRCGRWSALVKLGATLRAAPADEYTDYPRPQPMRELVENTPSGPRRTLTDPEDAAELSSV